MCMCKCGNKQLLIVLTLVMVERRDVGAGQGTDVIEG